MKGYLSFFIILILLAGLDSCKTAQGPSGKTQKLKQLERMGLEPLSEIDTLPHVFTEGGEIEYLTQTELPDTLSIIGVGDIMMGTNFPDPSYLPQDSGKYLLDHVKSILASSDVTFGNLEGVLKNEGGTPKNCNNPKACYLFRSPLYLAYNLRKAGFDLLSVANNHAGDFGNEGRASTSQCLDSLQLAFAGFSSRPYTVIQRNGFRIGFAAFAPNTGTISIHDPITARTIIQTLDSISDIIIVSIHAGAEGSAYQHVTREDEIFFGEDRGNVYQFAHQLIDWGADVVFGHGPHVTRSIEVYKNRFIAYSLGNFCTFGRFNLRGPNGVSPIMKITVNKDGVFLKGTIIPVKQIGSGYPIIDETGEVIKIIKELLEKDFPETPVSVGDSGLITYIQNP